jgi:hypothetical protein
MVGRDLVLEPRVRYLNTESYDFLAFSPSLNMYLIEGL